MFREVSNVEDGAFCRSYTETYWSYTGQKLLRLGLCQLHVGSNDLLPLGTNACGAAFWAKAVACGSKSTALTTRASKQRKRVILFMMSPLRRYRQNH